MPRTALLLAAVGLCGLTALVLLGAGLNLRPPATLAVEDEADAASRAVVVRFYDAVNLAISSGDLSLFERVVAPDFVDLAGPKGAAIDRAELDRQLRALHATAPEVSLTVETLVAEADRVVAHIAVRGIAARSFVGLSGFDRVPIWGPIDIFRIAGGRIVERWSAEERPGLLEPLGRISLGRSLPAGQFLALHRVPLAPGQHLDIQLGEETRLIAVETGAIEVTIDPTSPTPALLARSHTTAPPVDAMPGAVVSLAPGDLLVASRQTHLTVRGKSSVPTQLLVVTLADPNQAGSSVRSDPAYGGVSTASPAPEAAVEPFVRPVAGGRFHDLPAGAASVAFGRATLAPHSTARFDDLPGTVLLAVESGRLDLEIDDESAWVTDGTTGASRDIDETVLAAGDGAQLWTGTSAVLTNDSDEPLVVLIVTFLISPVESANR